jgi:hypothetical protein
MFVGSRARPVRRADCLVSVGCSTSLHCRIALLDMLRRACVSCARLLSKLIEQIEHCFVSSFTRGAARLGAQVRRDNVTQKSTLKRLARRWVNIRINDLVVRAPGSIPGTTKKKVMGLERGPLSLVSTTEELLDRKVAAPV